MFKLKDALYYNDSNEETSIKGSSFYGYTGDDASSNQNEYPELSKDKDISHLYDQIDEMTEVLPEEPASDQDGTVTPVHGIIEIDGPDFGLDPDEGDDVAEESDPAQEDAPEGEDNIIEAVHEIIQINLSDFDHDSDYDTADDEFVFADAVDQEDDPSGEQSSCELPSELIITNEIAINFSVFYNAEYGISEEAVSGSDDSACCDMII